jgi:hypothetical protein
MSRQTTSTESGELRLSDLDGSASANPDRRRAPESAADFELSIESTNRDIEAARMDLQSLMARAHAYASTTGVASGTPLLSSMPPRHRPPP